ncbi:hypothetical protein M0802_002811 [Mischocyttarus mexicanus]|nr:hypothetical protein M0802_002811 [Mischocyttarus mexicanus]
MNHGTRFGRRNPVELAGKREISSGLGVSTFSLFLCYFDTGDGVGSGGGGGGWWVSGWYAGLLLPKDSSRKSGPQSGTLPSSKGPEPPPSCSCARVTISMCPGGYAYSIVALASYARISSYLIQLQGKG